MGTVCDMGKSTYCDERRCHALLKCAAPLCCLVREGGAFCDEGRGLTGGMESCSLWCACEEWLGLHGTAGIFST